MRQGTNLPHSDEEMLIYWDQAEGEDFGSVFYYMTLDFNDLVKVFKSFFSCNRTTSAMSSPRPAGRMRPS